MISLVKLLGALRVGLSNLSNLTSRPPWRPRSMARRRHGFRPQMERLELRAVAATDMAIGMNLESVVDWSAAWTFTDAFKTSRPWISHAYNTATWSKQWDGGGTVHVDARGWPTQLNSWTNAQGQRIEQHLGTLMFRDIGTAYPAGTYRAEWEGTGTVNWGFAASAIEQGTMANGKRYALLNVTPNTDGIYMEIASMSSSDPIRNVHVWMPDAGGKSFAGQVWQPGASFSPFHPQFLEKLAPFKTIRFMDWAETNISDITTWGDRRTYDYATQQSGDFHNGVALEYMVQLCNELDADAWFNMPHGADDTFVRNFATLVRDSLEPGRKIYIEWSNELWNFGWGFEGSAWVTNQLSLPENAYLNGDRWALVAREAKRDFDIWSDVFVGQTNRMSRVVAGQEANSWIAEQIALNMGGHFDAISSAAYMYVSDADRNAFSSVTTADQVIDALVRNLPTALDWLQSHKALADRMATNLGRPISFVAYEGGPHLDSWGAAYQQAFFDAGNSPRIYDVYSQLLAGAKARGLDLFMHYNLTGGLYPSSFGAFGALQSMVQSTSTAPKYRALLDAVGTPSLPQVSVATSVANASETGPTAGKWIISRTGSTAAALTVNYVISGSASAADYSGLPATLAFAIGESSKTITITPVDDALIEGSEQVIFSLASSSNYTIDTASASRTITIADNDVAVRQGLEGTYYDNKDFTNPKLTRLDSTIGFNWGTGSPDSRIAKDTFSVRWVGQLQAIEAGSYTLRTLSDDGVRLWVNGSLVINNWTTHNPTYNTSPVLNLTAGQKVDIRLEYFENTGSAVIRFEWRRPGQTSFSLIPQAQLLAPPLPASTTQVRTTGFAAPAIISPNQSYFADDTTKKRNGWA